MLRQGRDLGGPVKRAAVFDIGSVSVKMLVAESLPKGGFVPLLERARVTRLGEGLEREGDLLPAAAGRTLDAVTEFAAEAAALGATTVEALGTEALRRIPDPRPFAEELLRRAKIPLRVLKPGEEASLAFLSAWGLVADPDVPLCILDIGGGSTEILSGRKNTPQGRALMPIGALRLKEACVHADVQGADEVSCMRRTVDALIERHFANLSCGRLVGMGGTVMVLASILRGEPVFLPESLHGTSIDREGVSSVVKLLCGLSAQKRAAVRGLPADRADLALPGAIIAERVMERLQSPAMVASAWGIRHGRMVELFGAP